MYKCFIAIFAVVLVGCRPPVVLSPECARISTSITFMNMNGTLVIVHRIDNAAHVHYAGSAGYVSCASLTPIPEHRVVE